MKTSSKAIPAQTTDLFDKTLKRMLSTPPQKPEPKKQEKKTGQ